MIAYDQETKRFHLSGPGMSYVMQIGADEQVHHLYWGKRLDVLPGFLYDRAPYRRANMVENQPADSPKCSREFFHYECPTYGLGDFRLPALCAAGEDGVALCDMRYEGYAIYEGAQKPEGLPGIHGDGIEMLELRLRDPVTGLRAILYYHLTGDVITRRMRVIGGGEGSFVIREAMSATVDFEQGEFDLLTLDGTTLREFTPCLRRLEPGVTEITSTRGISSHQHSPNIALLRPGADQHHGEVYGFSLVYSGNFVLRAEVDQYGACRLQGGINPFAFSWKLGAGESFDTPEIVLSWSDEGLNGLSQRLHPFVRRHILDGTPAEQTRPTLLNTWEACYFNVSGEKLLRIGEAAGKCGIELLVLDDGWFGRRNAANSSLGDWTVNPEKFPGSLDALSDALGEKGMRLGIWVELEMISPDSELYRSHPDWCLHTDGRVRTQWRNQLVLDMGREDVLAYLKRCMDGILGSGKIHYVKWDHNRRLTQAASALLGSERQGEVFHRYIMGTYALLDYVRRTYPQVLLENCASGGGRFDYGMYCYFHQGWLSDNTDAISRLSMQNAASIFFPSEVITSHVSACPNHQNGRTTPFAFRANVCALFNAGYALDVLTMDESELKAMTESVELFKSLRETVRNGRFTRLCSSVIPDKWYGWMVGDEARAVIGYYRPYCAPEASYWTIPLPGLEPDTLYRDSRTGETLPGKVWETIGLWPDWKDGDCFSQLITLEKVKA